MKNPVEPNNHGASSIIPCMEYYWNNIIKENIPLFHIIPSLFHYGITYNIYINHIVIYILFQYVNVYGENTIPVKTRSRKLQGAQ
jgi:hypothetical protein